MLAVASGAAALLLVFLLGAAGRPQRHRPLRRLPPATPEAAESPRGHRLRGPPLVATTAAGALVATLIAGPAATAVGIGVALVWRRHRRRTRAMARREAIEAALPDVVELLVLCVHAGRSPTQAIVEAARLAPPAVAAGFATVELQLHRGRRLADALGALVDELGPPARELATVVATADREGLPVAPVLDRLAADARAARRRLGDIAARRLPVRLSFPLVTCILPAFVLLAIAPAVLGAFSTLRGSTP